MRTVSFDCDRLRSVQDSNVILRFIVAVLPKHLTLELSLCTTACQTSVLSGVLNAVQVVII